MAWVLIRTLVAVGLVATSLSAQAAESCRALLQREGEAIDSYVMNFGPDDTLYIYILRMPGGLTAECTSQEPL
ncbi:hypothetical protein J8I29_04510 [Labrys sp. LIt4]|uniref:hypothetical protein n=1 Tax=Labrys sp. LIt4 TaxID=2821355 RepID=UPI001ADF39A7|nr:hypothetical protein [Labrys sp. LIt4]MBP0578564.1 hypothetical protein [Labrys sp. LIt4]